MKFYHDNAVIENGADTSKLDLAFGEKITVGKFVDKEKPSYLENRNRFLKAKLGDRFVPYRGPDNGH